MADLRDLALPDLVTPQALARVLGIDEVVAKQFLLESGATEIAGLVVLTREDLLAAIRSLRPTSPDSEEGCRRPAPRIRRRTL